MRICTIVGARPQFVKAAVVSTALKKAGIRESLVHTGQHYDKALSQVFFEELDIPHPQANLDVGSGSHARQTGAIMARLEAFLDAETAYDALLLYGDTNSTLAGALVAAKLHLPIAHVEAGLRSFDRTMPEEVNRVVTDCLAQWLFCPTDTSVRNLHSEGIDRGVVLCGDVMLDATRTYSERAALLRPLPSLTMHARRTYALATVHRAANTDNADRLARIFAGLGQIEGPVLLPLHPRTRTRLGALDVAKNITLLAPVSYLSMLTLTANARCVLTDSGGLQKEAYWLGVPCVTLRSRTEWIETMDFGWNTCVGSDPEAIVSASEKIPTAPRKSFGEAPDGSASDLIARVFARAL